METLELLKTKEDYQRSGLQCTLKHYLKNQPSRISKHYWRIAIG